MKIPVSPPSYAALISELDVQKPELVFQLLAGGTTTDLKGRYLHWDKLRHLTPPNNWSQEQWWLSIKSARRSKQTPLPLHDKHGIPFTYVIPDSVLKEFHWLDRFAAGSIQSNDAITNESTRNTYLIRSLIEEAISSSQLEGASTTRDVAKEMIREARPPRDHNEQMILNNYASMQFIGEIKDEPLTPSIVFEIHRLLTQNTLDAEAAGHFRTNRDDIHVVDNRSQEHLHTPPKVEELSDRLNALCEFANSSNNPDDNRPFLHPVLKAIALHFMLAYDHPFCDGNGRTARALFYWSMAREGYWLMEFVSISNIIKQAPAQYSKAFLHTETDDQDLTYFILHQLEVIHKAIDALHAFLDEKMADINEAEQMLVSNPRLHKKLNFRQLALLRHALKHPGFSYVVEEHQRSHGVSYDIARKDLLRMADNLKLLLKTKQGKRYFFVVPRDLEQRLSQ